jgi:hypothetical protein
MSGWADQVGLARHELELVRGGRADELPAAQAERAAHAATLGQAPAAEREALERLVALQDQVVIELTLARDEVVRELAALRRGRGAVQGYRSAAGGSAPPVVRTAF